MSRPRQTLSYLRTLFARHGITPRRQYGQNFLIDLNIHDLIVKTAEVGPEDVVLEVGPGAGAMTSLMAESAGAVVAVEIDAAMARLAREAVEGYPNVRVLHVDALAGKHTINPEVIDNVLAGLAASPGRRFKLVANLPYNIATPLITNLLVHPEPAPLPERMVVTIQLELAEKMRAEPGTDEYGGAVGHAAGPGRRRGRADALAQGFLAAAEGGFGGCGGCAEGRQAGEDPGFALVSLRRPAGLFAPSQEPAGGAPRGLAVALEQERGG